MTDIAAGQRADVQAPSTVTEASALLAAGVADRLRVEIRGGGSKPGWGAELDPVDLRLRTVALNQLLAHRPGDMTASVQAGMPLADLQLLLAEHGQWLALDPPSEPFGATVGGLLATGEAGPRRLRYGTMRDLAIGATVVLADGTIASSGSHVIKNVAGYDLTKLFHGSLGSLGLIAEVIVRLHPLPPASAVVHARASAAQASMATRDIAGCGAEPTAVEWVRRAGAPADGVLAVRFDGSAASTVAAAGRVATLLQAANLTPQVTTGADAALHWRRQTAPAGPAGLVLRAGARPDRMPGIVAALDRLTDASEVTASVMSSTALGLHTITLAGPVAAQAAVAFALRGAVEQAGGALTVRRPAGFAAGDLDPNGPPPSSTPLLALVKAQLDPDGRCAPGRFRGWF